MSPGDSRCLRGEPARFSSSVRSKTRGTAARLSTNIRLVAISGSPPGVRSRRAESAIVHLTISAGVCCRAQNAIVLQSRDLEPDGTAKCLFPNCRSEGTSRHLETFNLGLLTNSTLRDRRNEVYRIAASEFKVNSLSELRVRKLRHNLSAVSLAHRDPRGQSRLHQSSPWWTILESNLSLRRRTNARRTRSDRITVLASYE